MPVRRGRGYSVRKKCGPGEVRPVEFDRGPARLEYIIQQHPEDLDERYRLDIVLPGRGPGARVVLFAGASNNRTTLLNFAHTRGVDIIEEERRRLENDDQPLPEDLRPSEETQDHGPGGAGAPADDPPFRPHLAPQLAARREANLASPPHKLILVTASRPTGNWCITQNLRDIIESWLGRSHEVTVQYANSKGQVRFEGCPRRAFARARHCKGRSLAGGDWMGDYWLVPVAQMFIEGDGVWVPRTH